MRNTHFKQLTVGIALSGLLISGCSTINTFVDYQNTNLYSGSVPGNVPFVEIGQVSIRERGFVWDSCHDLTARVSHRMQERAERSGANRIIDVQWLNHAEGVYDGHPICTTGWGWFAAAGVGGLGPWVRLAQARGILVYAEDTPLELLKEKFNDNLLTSQRQREVERHAELERQRQLRLDQQPRHESVVEPGSTLETQHEQATRTVDQSSVDGEAKSPGVSSEAQDDE